ncbi:flavin-containing monooxygenase [Streptomyces sp. 4F14]|uniref:flavin-containing monooxygenase n=1 Tax=Streptomyces sp. 4F14 TaxID=3394380 RepID=UPI003A882262
MSQNSKVLIVGSGGNAIAIAARLQQEGIDYRIITAHSEFGGTWFINRYPGCGVDTPAAIYQFGFALNANWSHTYPAQSEVYEYLCSLAKDYRLYEKTDFNTEMTACSWDSEAQSWAVDTTSNGRYFAQHLVLATGFLDVPIDGRIPGRDVFTGRIFHSQQWPEGYTGQGDRMAVVGSGSSALQIVPAMQAVAASVKVFQRTPTWVMPMNNHTFSEDERQQFAANQDLLLQARTEEDARRSSFFRTLNGSGPERDAQLEIMTAKALQYLEEQVPDPELRKLLTPDHNLGCKRPGHSDKWYQALQQPNVELVPEAAAEITEREIISLSGRSFEVDTIVLATGFHWGTHILNRVHRRDGQSVADAQAGHPRAYKGLMVSQCPNLYLVGGSGPNCRTAGNGLRTGEITSSYVVKSIEYMDKIGVRALEVREEAETAWKRRADEVNATGVSSTGECTNYVSDKFGNNMADWPGDERDQTAAMNQFVAGDYQEPV